MARLLLALLLAALGFGAGAREAVPVAEDAALEARVLAIAVELRCLVCQNQTIADSHADLAVDLRNQIRAMLKAGASDADVRRYMTDRYGDFVLYKPPLRAGTALLWAGPALLLVGALAALVIVLRRRQRMSADAFDPDDDDDLAASR
jgi:cytochrome c-type biogenesis protein CcmH